MAFLWAAENFTGLFAIPEGPTSITRRISEDRVTRVCEGKLFRPSEESDRGSVVWLELAGCLEDGNWKETTGRVRVTLYGQALFFSQGDRIRFRGVFKRPANFENPGRFDFISWLELRGVTALASVSDSRWMVALPRDPSPWWQRGGEKIGGRLRGVLSRVPNERGAAFLRALLLGERRQLSRETKDLFQKTGTAHVLAISGLHVGMVTLIFLFLWRLTLLLKWGQNPFGIFRWGILSALLPVWFYIGVAGFPVSAVRAGLMATVVLPTLCWYRRLDLLSAWALAAFVILALSPLSLFQPSFQLSFSAVLFLILFFPRWRGFSSSWKLPFWLKWPLDGVAVTLLTLAGVFPWILHHFHEIGFAGIGANLFAVPALQFVLMPLAMAGWWATGVFGFSAGTLWEWGAGAAEGFIRVLEFGEKGAGLFVFHGAFSPWEIFLYYGACAVLFLWHHPFKRRLALGLPLAASLLIGGWMMGNRGELQISFLDVGQGDCAVIRLPNRKVWVVDGGGIKGSDFDVGRFAVAPYLWGEGIRRVDALFLTHPHADHFKGLAYLAKQFRPKTVYLNGDEPSPDERAEYDAFLDAVRESGAHTRIATSDTPALAEGDVRLEFLLPGPEGPGEGVDRNDNSMVLRLTYKNVSFLLTGDLMAAGEGRLLESGPDLSADVLKVGHHGSNTSTTPEFLRAVRPRFAIIPVGRYNTYGMPGEAVTRRLEGAGVTVHRTDRHGAVFFTSDGEKITVSTFVR